MFISNTLPTSGVTAWQRAVSRRRGCLCSKITASCPGPAAFSSPAKGFQNLAAQHPHPGASQQTAHSTLDLQNQKPACLSGIWIMRQLVHAQVFGNDCFKPQKQTAQPIMATSILTLHGVSTMVGNMTCLSPNSPLPVHLANASGALEPG